MRRLRLTIDPEASVSPVYELLAGGADLAAAELVSWNVATEPIGTLVWIRGDVEAFADALSAVDSVREHEVLALDERRAYVYVRDETTAQARALFDVFQSGPAVVNGLPAVEYNRDGTATLRLLGPAAAIDAVIDAVPDSVAVEVEAIGAEAIAREPAVARLSERQREALETALALGYYDRPREATDEDLAAAMGCSPSTASEHRAKGEARLVRALLGE